MFRRLESIKGCGIFEDFHWNTSVADFERINLRGTPMANRLSYHRFQDLGIHGGTAGQQVCPG
jgi:hypothetical protein